MRNDEDFTKEQLIRRIQELERLNHELLKEKNQEATLEFAWTGNLGHWYWDMVTNAVTFNPLKVTTLGYELKDLPEHVTYQFFTDKLHPEDYSKSMEAMRNHLYGKAEVYEVEYRIRAKDGSYRWYYDRGRITQYGDDGKPVFLAGIVFDITDKKETQLELERRNEILSEMSSIDGLTQIHNHRTLIEFLKTSAHEADRSQNPLSIALFDIDDFKRVNDSKGHVFGDKVLRDVAKIIKNSVRDTDLAGRYGGEEFMVVYTHTDLAKAKAITDRIRQRVEEFAFGDALRITISGGVKQYAGEDVMALIHGADQNLYKAKKHGKNLVIA